MNGMLTRDEVMTGVGQWTVWWVTQRMGKLREEAHHTMSVNPFLAPILFELHHAESFADLGELLLAGHLMVGHTTGFGKLVDEKLLPNVFGTHKLSAAFRRAHPPLSASCFDDIDHLIPRPDGSSDLLSLKTSRWTIQLASAVNLNRSFAEILGRAAGMPGYPEMFGRIVVGVATGTLEGLTDKYRILRGINLGAAHSTVDVSDHVDVLAGRDFWAWLNRGEQATQDWVLDGILAGLRDSNCRDACRELLASYTAAFNRLYDHHVRNDGTIDWHRLLTEINE